MKELAKKQNNKKIKYRKKYKKTKMKTISQYGLHNYRKIFLCIKNEQNFIFCSCYFIKSTTESPKTAKGDTVIWKNLCYYLCVQYMEILWMLYEICIKG